MLSCRRGEWYEYSVANEEEEEEEEEEAGIEAVLACSCE